ncbi:hypothetical protein [Streptacidiphilus cavernicola]|uniref:Uncharacterized protein n=1 Tax=Streptacidiphilus cavernicola TaxID=3342716 RepID=A0ABV6VXI2_9ACTN
MRAGRLAARTGRLAVVLAVAAALVGAGAGGAAAVQAPNAAAASAPQDACGALAADRATAPAERGPSGADAKAAGTAAQTVSYRQPTQLPIGLWSAAAITLRVPAGTGTVRLDLVSKGFSTDSVEVQHWVPTAHKWVDLAVSGGAGDFPTKGGFSFPLSTTAAVAKPFARTVALRLQDLDRPGSLAVTASYTDAHHHVYRAPVLRSTVTRPQTRVTGWPAHAVLVRGGAAQKVTMTVHNTTDRAYPSVATLFYAYGMGGNQVLAPDDLVLQQYLAGTGWIRLPLTASPCDPGMSAVPRPVAGTRLAPGATETVQLRLAVAATAPPAVTHAEAGFSVQSGDATLASTSLPFTLRAPAVTPAAPGDHGQRR